MRLNVAIIGAGGVGSETVQQICKNDLPENGQRNPTDIVAVADSKRYLLDSRGIDPEILRVASHTKETMKLFLEIKGEPYAELGEILHQVGKVGLDGEVVFVDATSAGKEAMEFHKTVLADSDNKLVAANKNPLSRFGMADFIELTRYQARHDYNTTVMAGGGAIDFAIRRFGIGDKITEIEGMLSGTMGYIFSELEKGAQKFSDVVKDASAKGYTEPNPYDDLNGVDIARKLVILCRCSGYDVDFKDVQIEPLLDDRFAKLTGKEFWMELAKEDERFAAMLEQAKVKNQALRYTAKMELVDGVPVLSVAPRAYESDSPFSNLRKTQNLARFQTKIIPEHFIQSSGAGLDVTAASIRAGIKTMLPSKLPRH